MLNNKGWLLGLILPFYTMTAYALSSDSQQPLTIDSMSQSVDMQRNLSIFTDEVVLQQGSIKIHADKINIYRPEGDGNKTYLEAFGRPVVFEQKQDSGVLIKGHSNTIRYDVAPQKITLIGDAFLQEGNKSIKSEKITYLVQQQKMQAYSDKGKRVTTVFTPESPQTKQQKSR